MLEKILRFSIANRFMVILLTAAAAGVGIWSLAELPIDAVPDITNNQVQINTAYSSLGPEQIEKQITFPIETALSSIEGLDHTRSLSRNGFSQVTAVFEDSLDIYQARARVAQQLTTVTESLPDGAEPTMGPITTGLGEVFMYAVRYERADDSTPRDGQPGWQSDGAYLTPEGQLLDTPIARAAYLRTLNEYVIAPQLRQVRDLAGVDAIGGYEKKYLVQPDPIKLLSYGLGFADLSAALENSNISLGAQYIENEGEAYQVRINGLLRGEQEITDIIIAAHGGAPIRIGDVATVRSGGELRTGSASMNGQEVVIGTAMMLIGGNSRTVAAAVGQKIDQIAPLLPAGITAQPLYDRTRLVDQTIHTIAENLLIGAILVIVVLFALLGNFRAALITALAIPLSMLLMITGMVQSDISANLLSLGALDFGIIVDGSVVIVENCIRRLALRQHELGRVLTSGERLHEVTAATREVLRPSVYGQAIIITVYIPILTLTGVEGKMFTPMSLAVIFALLAAFMLSITFIPAMVALCLSGKVREKENFVVRRAKQTYRPLVRRAVRLRWGVVTAALIIFAASAWLFTRLGQEFIPQLDEGDVAMQALRVPGISLAQSQEIQLLLEEALSRIPEVRCVFSKTGTAEVASDPMPPNISDTFIMLKPRGQWRPLAQIRGDIDKLATMVAALGGGEHDDHDSDHEQDAPAGNFNPHKNALLRLIELTARTIPGSNYEFTQPIEMRFNELISGVRSDIAVKVFGDEFDTMLPAANAIADVLGNVSGAANVAVEQTTGLPFLDIDIDRAAISRLGLSLADVQNVIAAAVGGRQAGVVFEGDRRFDVVVRLDESLRNDLDALAQLPIPLPPHEAHAPDTVLISDSDPTPPPFVPLGEIARLTRVQGLNQVSRENGKRRIVVQANVLGRDIGSFVTDARQRIARLAPPPPGTWLDWGGQFENLQSARRHLMIVVPICFCLIFLLLFSTFNSIKYALMVFICVPLALSGGIAALWLRGMPFSISAAVGFIALSGVAVLNGLVMVSFINELRGKGKLLDDAIIDGSLVRLRPVLMTALVAALGFVPMAVSTGAGAEVQKPLATVVIGGIVSSTLLTLAVLPAVYRIWHRQKRGIS